MTENKEVLQWKEKYLRDHIALIQTQSQLLQIEFDKSQAELNAVIVSLQEEVKKDTEAVGG